jgi:hypothetical protein
MRNRYLEGIDSTSLALGMSSQNEKLTVEVQLNETRTMHWRNQVGVTAKWFENQSEQ